MNATKPDAKRCRQLSADLWIIGILTLLVPAAWLLFGNGLYDFACNRSVNILLRVLAAGVCQYAISGLGITVVCSLRKEPFHTFGLNTKNLLPALVLSLACCVPDFLYHFFAGAVQTWLPFQGVNFTKDVLTSAFPQNVLGILIIAICWGFWEGFGYVVISDKISELYPSKYRFFDWGALVCALSCLLIHAMVGVTFAAFMEMLTTFIIIYGMLMVRKETGNAWGCVLIFMIYWNAV